jgi:hypothetical protein
VHEEAGSLMSGGGEDRRVDVFGAGADGKAETGGCAERGKGAERTWFVVEG